MARHTPHAPKQLPAPAPTALPPDPRATVISQIATELAASDLLPQQIVALHAYVRHYISGSATRARHMAHAR